jgi:hypothetical protein
MLTLVLGGQPAAPLRGLGGRRPLLVPPDRLLLRQGLRGRDAGKKAFVANRIGDFGFVLGIFGVLRALRDADFSFVDVLARPATRGDVRRRRVMTASASRSSSAPAARARRSRSTSGSRTRWPARRPSPRSSTRRRWSRRASTSSRAARLLPDLRRSRARRALTLDAWSSASAAHGALRGDDRPRAERHQEGPRVLDGLAARLHVPRLRRRRVLGGHVPRLHARVLQGLPLPRRGLRDPRDAPASRT